MNKLSVIKALQTGLSEAIEIIKYQHAAPGPLRGDAIISNSIQQLEQLLRYSEHIHDESSKDNHPLYDN